MRIYRQCHGLQGTDLSVPYYLPYCPRPTRCCDVPWNATATKNLSTALQNEYPPEKCTEKASNRARKRSAADPSPYSKVLDPKRPPVESVDRQEDADSEQ